MFENILVPTDGRFARSLRTNFQQLGDVDAVNKAMRVELSAMEVHLKKA